MNTAALTIRTSFFAGTFGLVPGTGEVVYCPPRRPYVVNLNADGHAWVCPARRVN